MCRLKECFCGCSVRTGTFVVLWMAVVFSTLTAMACLAAGHGMAAAIDLFQALAEYAYNAAKFFYHQTKAFGGDANIEGFETVLRASQSIDPRIKNLARIFCTFGFYWNFLLILVAIVGLVAVHQKKQYLLLPFPLVELAETAVYILAVGLGCLRIQMPSSWLIAFPGLISIAFKMYCISIVLSHYAELKHFHTKKRGPETDDVECAKDTPLKKPLND